MTILWIIPPISALIGWATNFLAVKMMFRPHLPIRIAGITIWGLIPKRKSDLAQKIGEMVQNELISHKDIHDAINTADFHDEILVSVMKAIDNFINEKLSSNPLIAMMLSGDVASQIKDLLKEELRGILPDIMENMFEKIEGRLDFKEIVRKKIEEFDLIKLEDIIYTIAARELKSIEILGGILGFVIGLGQVGLLLLTRGA